jgi:alpha-tubulin suppressor-like RCC1 family protein
MTTNYRMNGTDFDDLFVRKDIFTEGGLWLWGFASFDNTNLDKVSPVQIFGGGTNWKLIASSKDTFSDSFSESHAGIKTDGTLWTWGRNGGGQLGDNTTTHRSSPAQTISSGTNWKTVSVGSQYTLAIKTDGNLWLWGKNDFGQLGTNDIVHRSSPVQTVAGGINWKQISGGWRHTAGIKTDGTLWLWGYNLLGQLGDNTIVSKSSPVQTIAGGTTWKQVSCGSYHTAAIKTDGTLWTWGGNGNGVLGDNTRTHRSSPVQTVAGGTNWKQVSCGDYHISSIKTDGTLWSWGYNNYGVLGDNTQINKSSPVQTVAGGTNWKQVDAHYHNAAVKTDGTLWLWGYNLYGQIGDNTNLNSKSSPVQTAHVGTNWKMVSAGGYASMGIRGDYWA